MSYKSYSEDTRRVVLHMINQNELSMSQISCYLGISRSTIRSWIKRFKKTGDLKRSYSPGAPQKVSFEQLNEDLKKNPDQFLSELAKKFKMTPSGIWRALQRNQISKKKKTVCYQERNEEKRALFLKALSKIPIYNRVYLDESGFEHQLNRESGWSIKGSRLFGFRSGKKLKRINLIAAYCEKQVLAPIRFEGMCDREFFKNWVGNHLVPELKKGQVVILDNASFHYYPELKEDLKKVGCSLLYLPTYSPDLNPIERFWSKLKSCVRHYRDRFKTLESTLDFVFQTVLT